MTGKTDQLGKCKATPIARSPRPRMSPCPFGLALFSGSAVHQSILQAEVDVGIFFFGSTLTCALAARV